MNNKNVTFLKINDNNNFINNSNSKFFEYHKDLVIDSYADYNLDNTFCIFKSINDIFYLIYSNHNNSIISYNLSDNKKINEIKYAHDYSITNYRYFLDKYNKRDLVLSISCENNNLKIWDINNWNCLINLQFVNERGYLFSAYFLNDNDKNYIATSNAIENPEPIKIFDFKGNKIKEIEDSYDITYFIDTYYENAENCELTDIYIITGNLGYIKSFNYYKTTIYHKYCDNNKKGHCSIIIVNYDEITKLIESGFDGKIRIWNFHTGLLSLLDVIGQIKKIEYNNILVLFILFFN